MTRDFTAGRAERGSAKGNGMAKGNTRTGRWGGEAPRAVVQAMRCIPPDIQRMPAHQAHHPGPQPIYIIEPSLGALIFSTCPPPRSQPYGAGAARGVGTDGRRPSGAKTMGGTSGVGRQSGSAEAPGGACKGGRGVPATCRSTRSLGSGLWCRPRPPGG